jgi:hypothetical protein
METQERSNVVITSKTNQKVNANTNKESSLTTQSQNATSHERLKPWSSHPLLGSKGVDVKADGARVEILEVVEACVTLGLHLDGVGRALGHARALPDAVSIARNQLDTGKVTVGLGLVLVSGALDSRLVQVAELDLAGADQSEGGGLELGLLGEQEVGGAALVLPRGGDVEVEDGADGVRGGAVEGGGVCLGGLGGVDGDDQVRELEVLGEVARALLLVLVALLGVLRLLGVLGLLGVFRLLVVLRLLGLVVLAVVLLAAAVLVRIGFAVAGGFAVARLDMDLEPDLGALVLVLHGLGVDVPAAVVAGRAGPEGGGAVVGEVAVLDVEATVGFGALVALLLRGWGSQDAAALLAVVDACKDGSVNEVVAMDVG